MNHKKNYKDELIILKRFSINENDLLLTCFSYLMGKCTIKAKGSKRILSKFIGRLEPLAHITAEIYDSGKSLTLTTANLKSDPPMAPSLESFNSCQSICKNLLQSLPFNEKNIPIYNLTLECINDLKSNINPILVLHYFKTRLIELTGQLPILNYCSICLEKISQNAAFSETNTEIVCHKCYDHNRNHKSINLDTLKTINFLAKCNTLANATKLKIPSSNNQELETYLNSILNKHFNHVV